MTRTTSMPSAIYTERSIAEYVCDGYELIRSKAFPDLDAPCGRYFKYRDLIECGETQANTGLTNLPKNPDSYTALLDLTRNVLDPLIDYFGMIKLTYAFCSPELAKHIPGRIAPELDQHAAHEKKRNGRYVCERLGAACDFLVEDEDMEEVAKWVVGHLDFDRLYLIDSSRPIHVSYSNNPARQVVRLVPIKAGRYIPRIETWDEATTS